MRGRRVEVRGGAARTRILGGSSTDLPVTESTPAAVASGEMEAAAALMRAEMASGMSSPRACFSTKMLRMRSALIAMLRA